MIMVTMSRMSSTTKEQDTVANLRRELERRQGERSRGRARVLHALAWEMRNTDASEAYELADEALVLARSLRDVESEAFALVARAYAAVRRSHGADATEDAQAAVKMFREGTNAQGLFPRAHYATVYAKPEGRGMVDSYITEVSQDTWIFFPWDMALQYVEPYRGR